MSQSKEILEKIKNKIPAPNDMFIVYVDDELSQLEYVKDSLADSNIPLFTTTNVDEALQYIQDKQQDILMVISDLRMPNCDGFAFKEKVSHIAPQLPFIVLSGYLDTELALKCMSMKINGILNKPLELDNFLEVFTTEAVPRIASILEDRDLKKSLLSDIETFLDNAENVVQSIDDFENYDNHINSYFSIIHTIKGASSFFENKQLHTFTHQYEDSIKKIQNKSLKLSEPKLNKLVIGLDLMRELYIHLKDGSKYSGNLEFNLESTSNTKSEQKISDGKNDHTEHKKQADKEIKVSVTLLDDFLKLSGEVIVIKNLLNKCVSSIEKQYAGNKDLETLTELLEELHKINGGVQAKISEIRKVPLKTVFKPIHRGVREVTRSLNKKVNLQISGEDLSVDNSIAEVLNSSLLHIVKNCVDHGIEKPEDRLNAGKSETGNVKLTCTSKDDSVTVVIQDDGKGLNPKVIANKLISNGSYTQDQVKNMTDAELIQMIFSSGFSTAAQVTEISGRGVGMSMVKDSIESIGGNIKIESTVGKGSVFHLFLPIPKSVLIANCLFVKIHDTKIGITNDEVERVLNLSAEQIQNSIQELENTQTIHFENRLIPLISLRKLMNFEEQKNLSEVKIVILKNNLNSKNMAMIVDEILEFEDTIVKPMLSKINTVSFFKGATFIDEGHVSLVLNVDGMMNYIGIKSNSQLSTETKSTATNNNQSQALIVDIDIQGKFSLPQDKIYRIEEFDSLQLSQSGEIFVKNYRDEIIPVIDLAKLITNEPQDQLPPGIIPVIILELNHAKFGLYVKNVLDMVYYDDLLTDLANKTLCCKGHFFDKSNSIALLDIDQIMEKLHLLGIHNEFPTNMNVTLNPAA